MDRGKLSIGHRGLDGPRQFLQAAIDGQFEGSEAVAILKLRQERRFSGRAVGEHDLSSFEPAIRASPARASRIASLQAFSGAASTLPSEMADYIVPAGSKNGDPASRG